MIQADEFMEKKPILSSVSTMFVIEEQSNSWNTRFFVTKIRNLIRKFFLDYTWCY